MHSLRFLLCAAAAARRRALRAAERAQTHTPFGRGEAERAITNLLSRHVTDTLLCNTQHTTDVDWERGRAANGCETVIFLRRTGGRGAQLQTAAKESGKHSESICIDRRRRKRNVRSLAA